MATLYERLGGAAAVGRVVDAFYVRVLADARIAHFFTDVDMKAQIAKQRAFLTVAFGGPHRYTGQRLREGHAHLVERGLADVHVDAVVENLTAVLREAGVAAEDVDQVVAIAESARDEVLGRAGG